MNAIDVWSCIACACDSTLRCFLHSFTQRGRAITPADEHPWYGLALRAPHRNASQKEKYAWSSNMLAREVER
eukprot:491360-Pleurochrysis_carterae.AAC.1